jgi:hypothetical protein
MTESIYHNRAILSRKKHLDPTSSITECSKTDLSKAPMEHDTTSNRDSALWSCYDLFDTSKWWYLSFFEFCLIPCIDLSDLMCRIEPSSKRIDSERSDTIELLDTVEGFVWVVWGRHKKEVTQTDIQGTFYFVPVVVSICVIVFVRLSIEKMK